MCLYQCHSSLRTSCQPPIGQGVAKVTEQGGPAVLGVTDLCVYDSSPPVFERG